jgi:hypothetical protein
MQPDSWPWGFRGGAQDRGGPHGPILFNDLVLCGNRSKNYEICKYHRIDNLASKIPWVRLSSWRGPLWSDYGKWHPHYYLGAGHRRASSGGGTHRGREEVLLQEAGAPRGPEELTGYNSDMWHENIQKSSNIWRIGAKLIDKWRSSMVKPRPTSGYL